jgi:hypothetical protein
MEQEGPWEQEQYLNSWCALHDPSLVALLGSDMDKKVEDSSNLVQAAIDQRERAIEQRERERELTSRTY